jgi:hypothetical protein
MFKLLCKEPTLKAREGRQTQSQTTCRRPVEQPNVFELLYADRMLAYTLVDQKKILATSFKK